MNMTRLLASFALAPLLCLATATLAGAQVIITQEVVQALTTGSGATTDLYQLPAETSDLGFRGIAISARTAANSNSLAGYDARISLRSRGGGLGKFAVKLYFNTQNSDSSMDQPSVIADGRIDTTVRGPLQFPLTQTYVFQGQLDTSNSVVVPGSGGWRSTTIFSRDFGTVNDPRDEPGQVRLRVLLRSTASDQLIKFGKVELTSSKGVQFQGPLILPIPNDSKRN